MSEPLRICLIASSRFPVREPFMGGLEAHTHALASALVERGHDVSLFAAPGSDPSLGTRELPVRRFRSSARGRVDVGSPPEEWMQEHHAYLDLMLSLSWREHGRFDVVHNNSLHHLPLALSRLLEAPLVTTLHTPPVPWLESAATYAVAGSRFVAVSRHVAQAWQHVTQAEVIHNAVDTSFWTGRPRRGEEVRAVWSGRIVPEKAPHEAVRAAVLAGLPIDLAGPVHDREYFETAVRPLLGARVRYHGHLGAEDLRDLLLGARVALVTPHWEEPFGLVAAEALSCGTPVAGYDAGALDELVDEHTGCLVPVGDVAALAAAVKSVLALGHEAPRQRAVDLFSHQRMVDAYERTYRQVAGLRRAG